MAPHDDAGDDPDLNEDVGMLMQAYINEKCAPSILPYAERLVGMMIEIIDLQVRGGARRAMSCARVPLRQPLATSARPALWCAERLRCTRRQRSLARCAHGRPRLRRCPSRACTLARARPRPRAPRRARRRRSCTTSCPRRTGGGRTTSSKSSACAGSCAPTCARACTRSTRTRSTSSIPTSSNRAYRPPRPSTRRATSACCASTRARR